MSLSGCAFGVASVSFSFPYAEVQRSHRSEHSLNVSIGMRRDHLAAIPELFGSD